MGDLYIGLMSGTSADGVDAVLAELGERRVSVRAASTTPYPDALRARIERLIAVPSAALEELGGLDHALGECYAACALALLREAARSPRDIVAIGQTGQTVYHCPDGPEPFTLQLGDPNVVAARTGIDVVADLRRLDMALGGQGAPLMPAFHEWCFADDSEVRAVVNIGGIANVSRLRPGAPPAGFDTGPGNTLLDAWIHRCLGRRYDHDGALAASGRVDRRLLERLESDPYFARPPPKSTGREHFNLAWLDARLGEGGLADRDVQATLAELTASTIAGALAGPTTPARVVLCGGGAHNADLVTRLKHKLAPLPVVASDEFGVGVDWVEAAGCAWFARSRLREEPSNRPTVTGARQVAVLGGVYLAPAK